jgi:hypothetical protein
VWLQRRFERRDRALEQERQRIEIARALRLEIREFCNGFMADVRLTTNVDTRNIPQVCQVTLSPPPANLFTVYQANANRIGEFRENEVEAVIAFYSIAEGLLTAVRDAAETQYRLISEQGNPPAIRAAVTNLSKLQGVLQRADELAKKADSVLASRTRFPVDARPSALNPD